EPQGIRSVRWVSFGSSVWSLFGGLYALRYFTFYVISSVSYWNVYHRSELRLALRLQIEFASDGGGPNAHAVGCALGLLGRVDIGDGHAPRPQYGLLLGGGLQHAHGAVEDTAGFLANVVERDSAIEIAHKTALQLGD